MTRRFASSLLIAFMMLAVVVPIVNAGTAEEDLAAIGAAGRTGGTGSAGGELEGNDYGGAKGFAKNVAGGAGFSTVKTTPVAVAGALVNTFLSLIGIVFIILIIFAGFKWMTAGGNEEQVTKAKTTIMNSVIGIAVVMGAFVLYKFIEGIL